MLQRDSSHQANIFQKLEDVSIISGCCDRRRMKISIMGGQKMLHTGPRLEQAADGGESTASFQC